MWPGSDGCCSSVAGEPAAEEGDDGSLGTRHLLVAVRQLPEHPAGEDLLEPAVEDPAREPRVEVVAGTTRRAWPRTITRWIARKPGADLVHLPLELRAPRDLAHQHADEVGPVAPRAQERLRDRAELLERRLASEASIRANASSSSLQFSRKTVSSTSSFEAK